MFDIFFYNPVYNFVILLLNYIPDAGIVIIITTITIKFLLFPFHKKQIHTQIATKKAKPELDAIKEKYGKNKNPEEKQKMMMETMAVYKKHQIKPLSNILILIIQIPILLSLYWVFYKGGLPEIDIESLYSFVSVPKNISMSFLNIVDLSKSNVILALMAGVAQYFATSISMKETNIADVFNKGNQSDKNDFKASMKKDLAKSFQVSIKYGMPIFIFFLLTTVLNSAVAIYWVTSNVFQVIQELLVRREKKELKQT